MGLAFLEIAQAVNGEDAGARAADLAAFEALMRQHERLVLVTALRLLGNLEDAKDVSQEVFLRLYRNLRKVEAEKNYQAWLYRVTVNLCYDMGRKRKPSVAMDDAPDPVSADADPQQSLAGAERQRVLQMSLRTLSTKGAGGAGVARSGRTVDGGSGARPGVERSHWCGRKFPKRG